MTLTRRHPSSQNVKVATDAVILTVRGGRLHVLLIKMLKAPFNGMWALPGGLIGDDETAAVAAARVLEEQTGVGDAYMEQLMTFDAPDRDPFGRVVSIAHVALVPDTGREPRAGAKYADARWRPVARHPRLAYDHRDILRTAVGRVRSKLSYSNVAWSLLPSSFTLRDLQNVYEAILGRRLDKRNFLKKVHALELVVPTGRTTSGRAHRPARLYRFRSRRPEIIEVL